MRRLLFALLLFVRVGIFAQPHLQFMGIPINGNIENFHKRLQQKGLKYDIASKNAPTGVRGFTGTFSGYSAYIAVDYIPSSKVVHTVRVYIDCSSYGVAESIKDDLSTRIAEKYPFHISEPSDDGSKSFLIIQPTGEEPDEGDPVLGLIGVDIREANYEDSAACSVSITYSDIMNYMKYEEIKNRDL